MCVVKNGPIAIIGIVLLSLLLSCETNKEVFVSSVSLSHATAEMLIGETLQLVANVNPANATDKTVIWASSKQSVATISDSGLVTAIGEGLSTITASCGGKSGTCILSVEKGRVSVSSVSLNINSAQIQKGETLSLEATVKPSDATDKTVIWSSSNSYIAEVDQTGKVVAKNGGSVSITALVDSKTAQCAVTVIVPVVSINIENESITMVEGESRKLSIDIQPEDATDKELIWSSSNDDIVSVSDGIVLAGKPGEATVTVKTVDGSCSAKCSVSVVYKPAATAIFLKGGTFLFSAIIGEKFHLHIESEPADPHLELEWSVSDKSIASLEGTGRDVVLTALDYGKAIVYVKERYSGLSLSERIETKISNFYWMENTGSTYAGCPLVEIGVGEEYQLHCSYSPEYATRVFRKDMEGFRYNGFINTSPTYFSINDNGLIKGLKPGITHITTCIPVYKREGSSDLYVRVK